MIRRFVQWVKSWFAGRPSLAQLKAESSYSPVVRNTSQKAVPNEGFMQRQFRFRKEHKEARRAYFAALADRKPIPTVKQKCVCGCGTELTVERGTLQFYADRTHRHRSRQRFGAIDYGKARA